MPPDAPGPSGPVQALRCSYLILLTGACPPARSKYLAVVRLSVYNVLGKHASRVRQSGGPPRGCHQRFTAWIPSRRLRVSRRPPRPAASASGGSSRSIPAAASALAGSLRVRRVVKVDPGGGRVEPFLPQGLAHHPVGDPRRVSLPGQQPGEAPHARVQRLSPRAGQPPGDEPARGLDLLLRVVPAEDIKSDARARPARPLP